MTPRPTGFRSEICFSFCIFWFYLSVGEGNKKLSKVFFFQIENRKLCIKLLRVWRACLAHGFVDITHAGCHQLGWLLHLRQIPHPWDSELLPLTSLVGL